MGIEDVHNNADVEALLNERFGVIKDKPYASVVGHMIAQTVDVSEAGVGSWSQYAQLLKSQDIAQRVYKEVLDDPTTRNDDRQLAERRLGVVQEELDEFVVTYGIPKNPGMEPPRP